MTHDLWATLNGKMYEYLSSVTLSDLVVRQRAKLAAKDGAAVIADQRSLGLKTRVHTPRDKAVAAA